MSTRPEDPALWTELGKLGDTPHRGEAEDSDVVAGALAALDAGVDPGLEDVALEPEERSRGGLVAVAGIGGLLAIAAAVLVFLIRPDALDLEAQEAAPILAPSIAETVDEVGEAVRRQPESDPPSPPHGLAPSVEPQEPPTEAVDPVEPRPRKPKPAPRTADEMLREAQRVLGAGDTDKALGIYLRVIKRHPNSAEARASLVSVGRLELRKGKAKAALRHFDEYLAASAGPLREEARYGRIRSLRRLGRHQQELRSIESFLSDHPDSVYASRLHKRAQQLREE